MRLYTGMTPSAVRARRISVAVVGSVGPAACRRSQRLQPAQRPASRGNPVAQPRVRRQQSAPVRAGTRDRLRRFVDVLHAKTRAQRLPAISSRSGVGEDSAALKASTPPSPGASISSRPDSPFPCSAAPFAEPRRRTGQWPSLPQRLHRRGQQSRRARELFERETRNFDDDIVDGRLELAGVTM